MDPDDLQAELVAALERGGAAAVGFADLSVVSPELRAGLPRGISILVALDPNIIAGLSHGPTPEYYEEYGRANALLGKLVDQAVDFLRARGFAAQTTAVTVKVVDLLGSRSLPHKTVATRAGLGWIGHSAVLVTPGFGKAVRLTSVLTDAPFACGAPVTESKCGTCRACVNACPAGAITGRSWKAGIAREELYDAAACRRTALGLATAQGIDETICGICILACPWTRRHLRRSGASLD